MSLKGVGGDHREMMLVTLKTQGLQTMEQIRAFLEGSQPLGFEAPQRAAAYDFVRQQLQRFAYARLGKADKGVVRRYLCKVTGLSRAQMTRLIGQLRDTGRIVDRRGTPARPFTRRYTRRSLLGLGPWGSDRSAQADCRAWI